MEAGALFFLHRCLDSPPDIFIGCLICARYRSSGRGLQVLPPGAHGWAKQATQSLATVTPCGKHNRQTRHTRTP